MRHKVVLDVIYDARGDALDLHESLAGLWGVGGGRARQRAQLTHPPHPNAHSPHVQAAARDADDEPVDAAAVKRCCAFVVREEGIVLCNVVGATEPYPGDTFCTFAGGRGLPRVAR